MLLTMASARQALADTEGRAGTAGKADREDMEGWACDSIPCSRVVMVHIRVVARRAYGAHQRPLLIQIQVAISQPLVPG